VDQHLILHKNLEVMTCF